MNFFPSYVVLLLLVPCSIMWSMSPPTTQGNYMQYTNNAFRCSSHFIAFYINSNQGQSLMPGSVAHSVRRMQKIKPTH